MPTMNLTDDEVAIINALRQLRTAQDAAYASQRAAEAEQRKQRVQTEVSEQARATLRRIVGEIR